MNNLDKIGQEIVDNIKQRMDDNDISSSGNLKNSVHYVIGKNKIEVLMDEYAKFVDEGTEPHFINREGVEKISLWAENKGLPLWGVITNIKLYGTRAHPFLSGINDDIDNIVSNYIDEFFEYSTDKIYEQLRISLNKQ